MCLLGKLLHLVSLSFLTCKKRNETLGLGNDAVLYMWNVVYVPQMLFYFHCPSWCAEWIHLSIQPRNYFLSIYTVLVRVKCLLHTGSVLCTDKEDRTNCPGGFEGKSGHRANKWRHHTSQSELCPVLGTVTVVHDIRSMND